MVSTSFSETKIVYLDINYVINNSEIGKKKFKEIEQLKLKNQNQNKLEQESLMSEEKNIKLKQNILSKEEFNKSVNDFKKKVSEFNENKRKLNEEFNIIKKTKINEILKSIEPFINKYVDENSITMVIDKKNILIGKKDYDITIDIVKIINQNLK